MKTKEKSGKASGRSVILFQITALVVIVVIITSGLSLLAFSKSEDRLIQNSKDKLIKREATMLQSAHEFLSGMFIEMGELQAAGVPIDVRMKEFVNAIANKGISSTQVSTNKNLNKMIKERLLGVTGAIFILPAMSPVTTEPTIVMASDDKFLYKEIPKSIISIINKGEDSYVVMDKGVPALGFNGAHLVSTYKFPLNAEYPGGGATWFVDFKPLEKELSEIDSYYSNEKRVTFIIVGSVMGGSLIVLIIITFFVLSHLIHQRITKPIDELSVIAEQVMEGNLDVEVPMRPGEEFWNLKKVFNDMIKSLRDLIARATGQQ